jgi:phosphate transport system substrate-binding protein
VYQGKVAYARQYALSPRLNTRALLRAARHRSAASEQHSQGISPVLQAKLFSSATDLLILNAAGGLSGALQMKFPDLLQVPLFAQQVVVAYRIAGVARAQSITLSILVLSRIFGANITNWSDPQIVALNPGVSLPNAPIQVVLGSRYSLPGQDSLCTVFNRVDPMFAARFPCSSSAYVPPSGYALPAMILPTITRLLQTVAVTPNSIGYGGLYEAQTYGLSAARILNIAGNVITPTLLATTLPMMEVGSPLVLQGADLTLAVGPSAYPFTQYIYLILPRTFSRTSCAQRSEVLNFVLCQ